MNVRIDKSWKDALSAEWEKDYFRQLTDFVRREYATQQVFPPASQIFAAFDRCPFDKVKVVILGQDPYHGEGQANGLCFSVNQGVPLPKSLINIYKELRSDLGIEPPVSGDLVRWADQGVLLLNSTLTVRAHTPTSHSQRGWEQFTDAAIRSLAGQRENLVFILWGAYAIRKGEFIDRNRHLVITSAHPSPLSASRGFFGSRPFSRANEYLAQHSIDPIRW
ncbi:MAG: uracil-DNA glycosylase [Lachnoclostridium sp.]|nr:uracil-DNA glycosylase [Lachnoclostridium sp.]